MGKKKTQAYTEEFRKEAVRLADLPGNKSSQIAADLGISTQQIYNWRRQFNRLSDKQFNKLDGVTYAKEDSAEVRRLKRELEESRKENEFLKKAAAYFAKLQE